MATTLVAPTSSSDAQASFRTFVSQRLRTPDRLPFGPAVQQLADGQTVHKKPQDLVQECLLALLNESGLSNVFPASQASQPSSAKSVADPFDALDALDALDDAMDTRQGALLAFSPTGTESRLYATLLTLASQRVHAANSGTASKENTPPRS